MEINEFVALIESEFEEVESGSLTAETSIKDIEGWSSMHALILIALVDNHFDVLLTGAEMKDLTTIQELYNLVQSKLS